MPGRAGKSITGKKRASAHLYCETALEYVSVLRPETNSKIRWVNPNTHVYISCGLRTY